MRPTLFAKLALDGLAHKVSREELGIDDALQRAYTIGAKDQELQERIDTARVRAKELMHDTERENSGTGDPDPQPSAVLG